MTVTDIKAERAARIAATVDRIRAIERAQGITRAALAAMQVELMKLAAEPRLFPSAEFPPPEDRRLGSNRYLLQWDDDYRFALYMVALNPGNETKPHDHTTWAVIAAVDGQELNRVWRRTDDGSDPERCSLALEREVMVEPGRSIGLMPDDIHSIHTTGSHPTRHLHMYGLALEKLDQRRAFDPDTGAIQLYNAAFMRPTATARG